MTAASSLRRLEALARQATAQLLLAFQRLAIDDVENGALAAGFHGVWWSVRRDNATPEYTPSCIYADNLCIDFH